jgi:hypothetical protein
MDLTTAYATKRVELINKDGSIRDTFTLRPAEEWPEVVIFGVADARRTFVRDKGGKYREASSKPSRSADATVGIVERRLVLLMILGRVPFNAPRCKRTNQRSGVVGVSHSA